MTERWSGVFLEPQRRRCSSEADLEGERRWFSTGARRAVSKDGVFGAGARDANVSCRNEFEASR